MPNSDDNQPNHNPIGDKQTNAKPANRKPNSSRHLELHLPVTDATLTAVDMLEQASAETVCPLSRARIKHLMQCGAVWLTRSATNNPGTARLRRAKAALTVGDELHLYYDADVIDAEIPAALLIADEREYSVWYKPSSLLTQGTKWGDHHTIGRWAEQHLEPQRTASIVHRLDRHTSGVMLLAHNKRAARELSTLFRERNIDKYYHAIVHGVFGEVGQQTTITDAIDDKPAVSHVTVLAVDDHRSLVEVKIETGRKHQVRRHLSENGYPIVGDKLFGQSTPTTNPWLKDNTTSTTEEPTIPEDNKTLQLCAVKLQFEYRTSTMNADVDQDVNEADAKQLKTYLTPENFRPKLYSHSN